MGFRIRPKHQKPAARPLWREKGSSADFPPPNHYISLLRCAGCSQQLLDLLRLCLAQGSSAIVYSKVDIGALYPSMPVMCDIAMVKPPISFWRTTAFPASEYFRE